MNATVVCGNFPDQTVCKLMFMQQNGLIVYLAIVMNI